MSSVPRVSSIRVEITVSDRGIKRVAVHRAQDTTPDIKTPVMAISATEPFPSPDSLASGAIIFAAEARKICDALISSLPGGTIDALLVHLLEHKRSHFVVPHMPSSSRAHDTVYLIRGEDDVVRYGILRNGDLIWANGWQFGDDERSREDVRSWFESLIVDAAKFAKIKLEDVP